MELLKVLLLMTVLVFIYIEIRLGILWNTGGLGYYLNSPLYKKLEVALLIAIILQLILLSFIKNKTNK